MVCHHRKSCLGPKYLTLLGALFHLWLISPARAGWFNTLWPYRRPVEVVWDAEHASGDEFAMVEFYSAGHHKPNGEDIRVARSDGQLVAAHTIMVGPGDRLRAIFLLVKGERKYFVYFGNEKPEPPLPKFRDVPATRGLLMESRMFAGGAVENTQQLVKKFEDSQPVIGRTMIERPFLGCNPFMEDQPYISRLTGSLFIPQDGEYSFAGAVDDKGSLWLDGKPILLIRGGPTDSRQNTKLDLKRGRHEFVFYHVNFAGQGWFTVAWKRPDMSNYDVISREAFGIASRGIAGAMEMNDKLLIADFAVEYKAECFIADRFTHRYRFTANVPKTSTAPKFDWDFGDGQTSSGAQIDHVFLSDSVYPVRLTARIGSNSDSQTQKIAVSRLFEKLSNPPTDDALEHARITETYDITGIPVRGLAPAMALQLRSNRIDLAFKPAERLASIKMHADSKDAANPLRDLTRAALSAGKIEPILRVWEAAPPDSDLHNASLRWQAQIRLWWLADFAKCADLLAGEKDNVLRRLYGQALILSRRPAEGRQMLLDLPSEEAPERQVAISGALARTVEYFIKEGDAEAGEEAWERWQQRYPSDFLEGYSALLRVKLIELRKQPAAAAKIAEAFALAIPNSSYAPALLDRASTLMEKLDPGKSKSLREVLRQKYPEDPLANK